MKFAEKYTKLYDEIAEESFEKWGYYYPPKTWDELNAWDTKSFEKYLKDKVDGVKKTKSYVSLLKSVNDFGFYVTFQKCDYRLLNNVLYHTSRHNLLNKGILASGTDHCNVIFNALNSFSCNDFEIIDSFLPKELPLSKGTYYTEISVNLLKVLYYKQFDLKDEALQKADKFLLKKNTAWEKYVVLYFKALINKNDIDASNSLIELCKAYQKMNQSVSKLHNKLAKCFASEIHGLYRLAKVIDEDVFDKITRPKHHCFSEEFELWQKKNDFPKGKLFYEYPEKMDYMNKILEAELPTVALHNPYPKKKALYKDVDKFLTDLTDNANK